MTVPAALTSFTAEDFEDASQIVEIVFEPGSRAQRIERYAFGNCISLKTIYFPASVEVLGDHMFGEQTHPSPVSIVKFEAGSKLREIQNEAFSQCPDLTKLSLPGGVEVMDGQSFAGAGLQELEIESSNPHFCVKGSFLLDAAQRRLVRYAGPATATIPDEVEVVGRFAFAQCWWVSSVDCGPNCRVGSIEEAAFVHCVDLERISIPASTITIDQEGFSGCERLRVVSFRGVSQLRRIGRWAFSDCTALKSFTLPPSVETIDRRCFIRCEKLAEFLIPVDSKLARIEKKAFCACPALKSLLPPPSIEVIGRACFESCSASKLVFSPPFHLRVLRDLPPGWRGLM
jgi:hypothetical protein